MTRQPMTETQKAAYKMLGLGPMHGSIEWWWERWRMLWAFVGNARLMQHNLVVLATTADQEEKLTAARIIAATLSLSDLVLAGDEGALAAGGVKP